MIMGTGARATGQGRYGLLLATLIAAYLLSAFTSGRWQEAWQLALFVIGTWLALRTSALPRWQVRTVGAAVVVGSAIATTVALSTGDRIVLGAANLWIGLMLVFTVMVILYRVLRMDSVTLQSIYGALSAYLLIGMAFAAFYAAIDHLSSGDFFTGSQPANASTFQYFSFTTLTTLGYGDFTAASSGGRAVAVLEALIGQVFLATLVARLVSAYQRSPRRDPPGNSPGPGGDCGPGD